MPDRTNPAHWPTTRGPWHEVTGPGQLYDHGMPWCVHANGHPEPSGSYPDATIHPADECRTTGLHLDGISLELTGPDRGLETYAARSYLYGQPPDSAEGLTTRIVLDFYDDTADQPATRFSLPLGESLRLARYLSQLIDLVTLGP